MIAEWQSTKSAAWLDRIFREFHREPRSEVLRRERDTFDQLAAPLQDSIVLFGAGPLGRYTAHALRGTGTRTVAFADNNAKLWGTTVEGMEVLSPQEASRRYGQVACFVVTIYNGSAARQQLAALGCRRVVPFAPVFWKYSEVFIPGSWLGLPHIILDQEEEIRPAYGVLSDDASRRVFCEQLRWRFLLDYACLSSHLNPAGIYFPPDLVTPREDEIFVDCGAFDGDSIRSFLAHRNSSFQHVYAFESDPVNLRHLTRFISGLPPVVKERITVFPYAAANENAKSGFSSTGTVASKLSPDLSNEDIECRRMDDLLGGAGVTYIKMDIEGAEMDALRGAAQIIGAGTAVLAICVYHGSESLWRIPSLIKRLGGGYDLFIRRYAEECWELVCYAVPANRRPRR